MIIVTIRTDKPEAEIGIYENDKKLAYEKWQAHRQLSVTIHQKIRDLLKTRDITLQQLKGIVVFKGPGSFTGLRIGLSLANALAYSLGVPIVSTTGKDWIKLGIQRLQAGKSDTIALPEYGAPVHITTPKK